VKLAASILTVVLLHSGVEARTSYTAYSGAPGSKGICASSCHGSSGGTMVVTGVPATYTPGASYTITVKRNGGSRISNFNASTRVGTTTTGAGTFAAVSGVTTYSVSGFETGVRASSNNVDSAKFSWTAPATGTGEVRLYVAGAQGTSASGPNTLLTFTVAEGGTSTVEAGGDVASPFALDQNYSHPFNPRTTIRFQIAPVVGGSHSTWVTLKVFDLLGREVATLVNEIKSAGSHSVQWSARQDAGGQGTNGQLPSGITSIGLKLGSSRTREH
jgi:hypothetical protein